MTRTTTYRCSVCEQPLEPRYLILDRRVERVPKNASGKPLKALIVISSDSVFLYCRRECWNAHEVIVAEMLQARNTYPSSNVLTECCRCGAVVDRTNPYVSYPIVELVEEDTKPVPTGHVMDDTEFVVLCNECDDPAKPFQEEAEVSESAESEVTA